MGLEWNSVATSERVKEEALAFPALRVRHNQRRESRRAIRIGSTQKMKGNQSMVIVVIAHLTQRFDDSFEIRARDKQAQWKVAEFVP